MIVATARPGRPELIAAGRMLVLRAVAALDYGHPGGHPG